MAYPYNLEMPALFKIVKKEFLQDLVQGKLFMNNLQFFVDLEKKTGKQGVGDIREGSLLKISKHKLFIQYDGGERKEVEIGPPPGIIYDETALEHPVFCMVGKIFIQEKVGDGEYACTISLDRDLLNDFTEGNDKDYSVVLIFNVIDFLDRLEKAIKRAGLSGKSGFINYRNLSLPKIVDGELILDDTFTKDNRFKKQSEYRIELFKQSEEPFVLEIGDISDIAVVLEVEQIEKGLSIIQRINE